MIFRFKIKLNKFKTLLSVLICIFLFLKESPAQPVQEWIRKYNGPANGTDIANILLPDGKGNNIVFGSSIGAGSLNDIVIIKYDAHGNTIWEQRFNGEGNSTDVAASACVDNSGNSYITGYTADTDLALKIICMKYDSSGKPVWIRKFSLPGYSNGFGHNIVLDSNGSLYVSGFLRNTVGNYDIVLIKCHNRLTDTAKIVFKITTKLEKLTELVCRHDTGYSRDITINLLKKMYKGITDWNKQDIVIYGLDFKYKEKEITLIDSLHEDGVINKNNPKQSDQFLIDFLELSNK